MSQKILTQDHRRGRLSIVIDGLSKPLVFASKDDFAHIETIKGLGHLVERLTARASTTGLTEKERKIFARLNALFKDFDNSTAEEKKEMVRKGLSMIRALEAGGAETGPDPLEVRRKIESLQTPLQWIKGIGPGLAARLKKKGLATVEDMLYFLPIRYEDRSSIEKIKDLEPGRRALTSGDVMASGEVSYSRRKLFEAVISDGTGLLRLKWFNYRLPYMKKRFSTGRRLIVFGPVSAFGTQKEMVHPDVEIIEDDEDAGGFRGIVPVYSQIENLHQKTIRKFLKRVVDEYADKVPCGVPAGVLSDTGLMAPAQAFRILHAPPDDSGWQALVERARRSIIFDELFVLELGLAMKRASIKRDAGIRFVRISRSGKPLHERLKGLLPFEFTRAQKRVIKEIIEDMQSPHPMNRLLQGDVGSGKTMVCFTALLVAVDGGYQAALMAPTEILAEQHYLTLRPYCERLGVRCELIKGSTKSAERKRIVGAAGTGDIDILIGTHALIQKDVEFKRLGLVVIDEQHRFGVVQRAALKKKAGGINPDVLVMTATPIPRTLAMTVFGDLDVSVIDELPPGRTPVRTKLIREKDRALAYETIRKEVLSGGQAYIVYPLVEESDELSLRDATNMKDHLEKDVFPSFRVGLIHGRLKPSEKDSVMKAFKSGEIDILVSTTVIEVGVDVPNATVMLIEHAERFGLAQLHQLRGRVGRGDRRSICLLLARWTGSEDTYRRLKVMEETMDGFRLAEEDLRIRGPGDFLGTRQSGLPGLRSPHALGDMGLLKKAKEAAVVFLEKDPELRGREGACLKEVLKARWAGRLELAAVG